MGIKYTGIYGEYDTTLFRTLVSTNQAYHKRTSFEFNVSDSLVQGLGLRRAYQGTTVGLLLAHPRILARRALPAATNDSYAYQR